MPKKKAKVKASKKTTNPAPRQKSLPGMQDRKVAVLERAALEYADVRDERMRWTKSEVETKKRVKDLMHELNRQHYAHGNIEIDLVPEDEHVRVRIHDREAPVDEPVDHPPEPVEEPESPEGLPRQEPENPDEEYDSKEEEEEEDVPHF